MADIFLYGVPSDPDRDDVRLGDQSAIGEILCTLSLTDADDVLVSAGSSTIQAALTLTDEADALASTGSVIVSAALALTDETDTLSATGSSTIVGAVVIADENDTLDATATVEALAPEQPVSLGGRRWRMDYPLPEVKIRARFERLDDDDTVSSTASVAWPVLVAAAAFYDDDDQIQAAGRVIQPLRLIRATPAASLQRTTPKATLRRAA